MTFFSLHNGQAGQSLTSKNGQVDLTLLENGNLVMTCGATGKILWQSNKFSANPAFFWVQSDGSICAVDGTTRQAYFYVGGGAWMKPFTLVLQDLVLYDTVLPS